jgi:hypothetical protein
VQSFINYLNTLQDSQLSLSIAESTWAFPAIETIHIFAICMVFGSIAIVDLRLLGLASTNRAFSELSREELPWTWGAFALAALFGTLLLITRPLAYFENHEFRAKFAFMALAGVNMLVFQLITIGGMSQWDAGRPGCGQGRRRTVPRLLDRRRLLRPADRFHHGPRGLAGILLPQ